jgi:sulfotransferase famil protein
MIDHAHRVIFIHQRKCTGMSIMTAFGKAPKKPGSHQHTDGALSPDWQHRDRSYFVFSVVRIPFDRLISSWKYLVSTKHRTLLNVLQFPPSNGHDYRHLTPAGRHFAGSHRRVCLQRSDPLRSLQSDFDRICDRIGKSRVALPHLNTSERSRGYRQYFD